MAQPAAAQAKSADYTIKITNYKFARQALTIKVGQTVKWINEDSAPHTVTTTSGPAKFDSGTLQKGDSWSYTFTKPGTYKYYCAVHPDMKASVTAQGSSAPPPSPTSGASPGPTSSASPPPGSGAGDCTSKEMLTQLYQHLESAHLEESLGQQVADILNPDQYVKTHTVWAEHLLAPTEEYLTNSC